MSAIRYTPEQARPKIKQYCAYQERCQKEVREKLFSFGLALDDADEIISELITENYLDEERFAIQYAGGKFRMLHWGKNKIRQSLKQKDISEYCIRKGLNAIDAEEYFKTFRKLSEKKLSSLRSEKNIFIKKKKLQDYLFTKGFEMEMIREVTSAIGIKK